MQVGRRDGTLGSTAWLNEGYKSLARGEPTAFWSRAEQSRAEQSRAEQSGAGPSRLARSQKAVKP